MPVKGQLPEGFARVPTYVDIEADGTPFQPPKPAPQGWRSGKVHRNRVDVGLEEADYLEFNSFSGSDVQIQILIKQHDAKKGGAARFTPVTELQTLSISSARSKYPVRRLGESHVADYTSGARTIAGSMIFATASRDVFAHVATVGAKEHSRGKSGPFFTDELPPMMIIISAGNEYGHEAHAALVGVELTNFGTTFSVDDLFNECSYTYVAKYYYPLVTDPVAFVNELEVVVPTPTEKLSQKARETGSPLRYGVYRGSHAQESVDQFHDVFSVVERQRLFEELSRRVLPIGMVGKLIR